MKIFLCCFMLMFSGHVQAEDINAKLLATIRGNMNPEADPCQNFFDYTCGKWDGGNFMNANNLMSDIYDQRLAMILEGSESKLDSNTIIGKIRDFYASCKEEEGFNVSRLFDVTKPTEHDDWPQDGDAWNPQEKWNIWSTMGRLAAFGYSNMFFYFALDLNRTDLNYLASIYQHRFHYRIEVGSIRAETANQKGDIMAEGMNKLFSQIDEELQLDDMSEEGFSVLMTLAELQQQVENIDFVAFFKAFFGHDNFGNITIAVKKIEHIRKMGEIVRATSQDVLIHIIKRTFAKYLTNYMPLEGYTNMCIHVLDRYVPLALVYMYEREFYSHERPRTDYRLEKVFKGIQHTFSEKIQENSNQFSPEVVQGLTEKILNMKLFLGGLPQGMNDDLYEKYFDSWEVAKNDFYGNYLTLLKRRNLGELELLRLDEFSPLLLTNFHNMPAPIYRSRYNAIIIPYSYMQFPVLHPEFQELFMHSTLGPDLANTMLLGFDTEGLLYDAEGNKSMFNATDNPNFADAVKCIEKHKADRNGADANGFNMAYETYFQQPVVVPEITLKTEFSSKQLYFIKYAQIFCARRKNWPYFVHRDHDYKRVPEIVTKSPEFVEAFSCPQTPVKMCKLW